MKLKSIISKIPKRKKASILIGVGILLCLVIILSYIKNPTTANCLDIAPQAQQIFKHDPNATPRASEFRKRYQEIKSSAKTCEVKSSGALDLTSAKDNLTLLFFYYEMAIASNSFGDYKDSKYHADKALEFNDKVENKERGQKANKTDVKEEMGAIKNDKY